MKNEKALAIIGESAKEEIIEKLNHLGFEVFVLPKFERLPFPVASHTDMLLFLIDDKAFLSRDYAPYCRHLLEALEDKGLTVVLCDCDIKNEYPFDVPFNIAKIEKNIFANEKYICVDVKKYLDESEYSLHHIKQGYAKCSTVILSKNAIITADDGIIRKAQDLGIDALKIENSPSAVSLKGYNYGFLGGACGLYKNTLYFCGDISLHPEYSKIRDFCDSHNTRLYSLSCEPLEDIGGIFFID